MAPRGRYALGIDVGTQGTKALLYDLDTHAVSGRAGGVTENDSNAERSTTYLQGGCSYRRTDSVRGDQTIVEYQHVPMYPRPDFSFSSSSSVQSLLSYQWPSCRGAAAYDLLPRASPSTAEQDPDTWLDGVKASVAEVGAHGYCPPRHTTQITPSFHEINAIL